MGSPFGKCIRECLSPSPFFVGVIGLIGLAGLVGLIFTTFRFHWWTNANHPVSMRQALLAHTPTNSLLQLGDAFTFTPESYSTHPSHRNKVKHLFYLGYSIEKWCKEYTRFLPEDRLNQVYVLAKVSQETNPEV